MGYGVSRQSVLRGEVESDLGSALTPRQAELVRSTWAIVSQDLAGTGVVVFKRLLTRYPELCRLFRKFMTLREDGTYDWDMEGLQRHALLVMQGLEAAVENLDDSRVLGDILYELGRKHARFNVHEDMFDKLWHALKFGLEDALQDKFNREVAQAWFIIFRFLCRKIIDGMLEHRAKMAEEKAKQEVTQDNKPPPEKNKR
ncbi:neuroglobin-like [Ornithodoros turicata]